MRTFVISAALLALAACSQETQDATPDTTAETDMTAPSTTATPPASPSMTMMESDARSRIEAAGYTNVTGLTQNADGTWTATATQNGQTTQVVVDQNGVRVATTPTP